MELLDLVNEQDEVIGVTTKEKSHANREIHRIVAVNVFDKHGKLYLQEHLKSHGLYDHSVGGHVKQHESYDEAAKREAFEELNLTDALQKITTYYPEEKLFDKMSMHSIGIYEVHPSPSWKFVPNAEVKSILPFTLEETITMMNQNPEKFTSDFIRTMKKYLEVKNLRLISAK